METYTNNNKKPEITVIIPSYNVEEYIGECLESLKKQTFTKYHYNDISNVASCKKRTVKSDHNFQTNDQ